MVRRRTVAAGVAAALGLGGLGAVAYAAREPGPWPDPGPPRASTDRPTAEVHGADGVLWLALYADGRVYLPAFVGGTGVGPEISGVTQTVQRTAAQTEGWRARLSRLVDDGSYARLPGDGPRTTDTVTVRTAEGERTARYDWDGAAAPGAARSLAGTVGRITEEAHDMTAERVSFPTPAGIEVRVLDLGAGTVPELRESTRKFRRWPGGDLLAQPGTCLVERNVAEVYPVLQQARHGTWWETEQAEFLLQVRPLAPGETACL